MPVVTVWGLPERLTEDDLQAIYEDLCSAVVGVSELALTKREVTICFPTDRMAMGLGKEIIVFVDGLFEKPERILVVRGRLASCLGRTILAKFPEAVVECFIRTFNPASGFYSSGRRPLSL